MVEGSHLTPGTWLIHSTNMFKNSKFFHSVSTRFYATTDWASPSTVQIISRRRQTRRFTAHLHLSSSNFCTQLGPAASHTIQHGGFIHYNEATSSSEKIFCWSGNRVFECSLFLDFCCFFFPFLWFGWSYFVVVVVFVFLSIAHQGNEQLFTFRNAGVRLKMRINAFVWAVAWRLSTGCPLRFRLSELERLQLRDHCRAISIWPRIRSLKTLVPNNQSSTFLIAFYSPPNCRNWSNTFRLLVFPETDYLK